MLLILQVVFSMYVGLLFQGKYKNTINLELKVLIYNPTDKSITRVTKKNRVINSDENDNDTKT